MPTQLSVLVDDLFAGDRQRRLEAAEQLSRLGSEVRPAAVNLVKACRDESEEIREYVVAALEEMGPPRLEDSFLLAELLNDASADVGYWAATLLGRLKQGAAEAVPGLADVLAGPADLSVRQRAAWALGEIGPAARPAVDVLRQAEAEGNPRLARVAHQAREKIEQ
ncbi:MAG: HEAT repeat domain-containing protein [Rhodopirellula sp.]|nr:HEAT repeat domain-containing protein [Rhodopirellula sp.]